MSKITFAILTVNCIYFITGYIKIDSQCFYHGLMIKYIITTEYTFEIFLFSIFFLLNPIDFTSLFFAIVKAKNFLKCDLCEKTWLIDFFQKFLFNDLIN